uniref:hypothetical protein n=1 Tax=Mycolicibacterium obuense TaxID=1807 RepID=UPI003F585490
MARRKRDRHQQRRVHEWTATGAALKAVNMREEVVAAMSHTMFRSARSKGLLEGNRDLRHAIGSQHDNCHDEIAAHYAAMYDWAVASIELDAETASAMSAAFDSRLQRRMQIAEVFIVAPAMHRVVTAASATLEGSDLETLIRDDIPWENGFLVLPKRVQIGDSRGWTDVEAISWHVAANRAYQGLALYVHSWSRLAWAQNLPGTPLKLWPAQTMVLPLDPDDRIKSAEQHIPHELFFTGATPRPGWTPEASIAEAGPDNEYGWVCEGGPHAAVLGYLFAFLRIATQPMSIVGRCRERRADSVPQAWQRVRVVQLRRFHQAATVENDARQVHWRHSWIVRMHKVRQWYPSLGRHQVIFRGPYLKGPTDAPLLAGETVQALVR